MKTMKLTVDEVSLHIIQLYSSPKLDQSEESELGDSERV